MYQAGVTLAMDIVGMHDRFVRFANKVFRARHGTACDFYSRSSNMDCGREAILHFQCKGLITIGMKRTASFKSFSPHEQVVEYLHFTNSTARVKSIVENIRSSTISERCCNSSIASHPRASQLLFSTDSHFIQNNPPTVRRILSGVTVSMHGTCCGTSFSCTFQWHCLHVTNNKRQSFDCVNRYRSFVQIRLSFGRITV